MSLRTCSITKQLPRMTPDEWTNLIGFRLASLKAENGHHTFEKLCMAYARRRIASNLLPASGPISAGGDQGRDFETFKSYIVPNSSGTQFERYVSQEVICFACTTDSARRLKGKIRSDVESIMVPPPDRKAPQPNRIYVFTAENVPVAMRHKQQAWARDRFGIGLEIVDHNALTHALALPDFVHEVVHHLGIPRELAPVRSVVSLLSEVQERVSDVRLGLNVQAIKTADGETGIALTFPEDLKPRLGFNFPNTQEGNAARILLMEHVRTGAPVMLSSKFLAEIDIGLPESLLTVLGVDLEQFPAVGLPPQGIGPSYPCELVAEAGEKCSRISGVELAVVQAGSEEVTLSNMHQSGFPSVTIKLDWPKRLFQFQMHFEDGLNVKQQLEAFSFQSLLAEGAMLSIVATATGMPLLVGEIPPGMWEMPDEHFGLVLRDLYEIQRKSGVLFSAPRVIDLDAAHDVFRVARIVYCGELELSSIAFHMTTPGVRLFLETYDKDTDHTTTFFLAGGESSSDELFGKKIELGRSVISINGMSIDPSHREALEASLAAGKVWSVHEIKIEIPDSGSGVVRYERWLPEETRRFYFDELFSSSSPG